MPPKTIKNKNRKESPLWEDRELERRYEAAVDALFEECEGLPVHEQLIAIMERMGSRYGGERSEVERRPLYG